MSYVPKTAYVDTDSTGDAMAGPLNIALTGGGGGGAVPNLRVERDLAPEIHFYKRSQPAAENRWKIYISGAANESMPDGAALSFASMSADELSNLAAIRMRRDGRLTLGAAPTATLDAATKGYVDTANGLKVTKTGDSMSGALTFGSSVASSRQDLSKHIALYGSTYGFSITGGSLNHICDAAGMHWMVRSDGSMAPVQIGTPVDGQSAATVNYVGSNFFPLAGGTMSGGLTVNGATTLVGRPVVNYAGIQFAGFTNGGAYGANVLAMGWKSPNINGGVDNANNCVLGTVSARKWKTAIFDLKDATTKVRSLRPVEYTPKDMDGSPVMGPRHHGLIADEVKRVIPSAVVGEGDDITVNYPVIVPILVGAIQELTARIETLEKKVQELEKKNV